MNQSTALLASWPPANFIVPKPENPDNTPKVASTTKKEEPRVLWELSEDDVNSWNNSVSKSAFVDLSDLDQLEVGGKSIFKTLNTLTTQNNIAVARFLDEPVVEPEKIYPTEARYRLLQKWEGIVLDVQEESFTARLVDQNNEGPDEEAEFSLEEVTLEDISLLQPGAVFYWNIGFSDKLSGQRERVSIIRFRRLPVWSSSELELAKLEAARLGDKIAWK